MDQRLVKENVRASQIIKGTRRVKKNRCEGFKKLIQSLEIKSEVRQRSQLLPLFNFDSFPNETALNPKNWFLTFVRQHQSN